MGNLTDDDRMSDIPAFNTNHREELRRTYLFDSGEDPLGIQSEV